MVHIKEWEQANPTYTDDPKLLEEWHGMILCLMGGRNETEIKTNQDEIYSNEWIDLKKNFLKEISK